MKKIFFIILLSVVLFLAGNIGEVEAENGYSYYDVTITPEEGSQFQECWVAYVYEAGGGGYLYTEYFGDFALKLGDLGTDRKTWLIWGDGFIGCPGPGYINVYSRDLMFLQGEGVCDGDPYRVEGKKTDYCEGEGE